MLTDNFVPLHIVLEKPEKEILFNNGLRSIERMDGIQIILKRITRYFHIHIYGKISKKLQGNRKRNLSRKILASLSRYLSPSPTPVYNCLTSIPSLCILKLTPLLFIPHPAPFDFITSNSELQTTITFDHRYLPK